MEARYNPEDALLSFGWGSGCMEVRLDGLLPTNLHKLGLFAKALNDNIGYTPFGLPSAGQLVLDYIDTSIAEAEKKVAAHKVLFAETAHVAGIKTPDYDEMVKALGGAEKLAAAIARYAKPVRQKLSDVSKELKASQKKLNAAQKAKKPPWYIANLQYAVSEHARREESVNKEYLPWKTLAGALKDIRDALLKIDRLKSNKDFLSKKLKEE